MRLPKSAKKFPKILAEAMAAEQMNPYKFSAFLNIRHQRLYTWLHGQNLPPKRQAQELAEKLKRPDLVAIIDRARAQARSAKRRTADARPASAGVA